METRVCSRKDCAAQGAQQPIDVFPKDSTRKSGYHPYCRACRNKLAQARMQRPEAQDAAREAQKRYRESEDAKIRRHEYYLAHKAEYRARERERTQRPDVRDKLKAKAAAYREQNQLKDFARRASIHAIQAGRISKPDHCEWCGQLAAPETLEGHHWRGYEPEFWLDLKFVHADPCHVACENVAPEDWP